MIQTVSGAPTTLPAGTDRYDWYVMASLIALWGLIEVIINPVGDFPLNDDWAYGLPVKWLVEERRLRFTRGCSALFTQVIWGSLFVSLAGFSFTVLRISTIVMAAVGLSATYLTAREVGLSRGIAAIVVGLLEMNPVFVTLANTFMSDVPFLSLAMLSILLFLRGLKYDRPAYIWAGWAIVLAATLQRQVGIAIPIGLIAAMAIKDGMNRVWLFRAVFPSVVVLAVVLAYPRLLEAVNGASVERYECSNTLKLMLIDLAHLRLGALKPIIYKAGWGMLCLGQWMLPLIVLFLPSWSDATTRRGLSIWLAVLSSAAAAVTGILWFTNMLLPSRGNIGYSIDLVASYFIDLGTGPRELMGGNHLPRAPRWFPVVSTWAAAFGAISIVLALGHVARRAVVQLHSGQGRRALWLPAFSLVSLVFYYAPFCVSYLVLVDRYALPLMPLLTLLLAGEPIGVTIRPRPILGVRVLISAALAFSYLVFAVASAHDYLAWNRQRWAASSFLLAQGGVTPDDINGGFAFNGYYEWQDQPRKAILIDSMGFESNDRSRYAIAFEDRPGFRQVRRLSVDRWLPLSPEQIVILERSDGR